ncbi:tRNA (N6-isopentenyl adenosine(37)-C2)-methylthiotransferase MiaB [bacterium (Candidatus Howlettbacteria) CG_4_10_14_0_8_um_filter_40_9]|nr:MAG: tRNA (N6-isopentenyl adenosine(37)-C2)-methylthiotransferase MiaB [bacterium (Candidatus Howlettbacteria) CG_4_10_14_0_8_um_filter_40_9]
MNKKKYYLLPLGCAQNISDAERVSTVLEENRFVITSDESEADLICVIACSVRQSAIDRIYGRSKIWGKYKKKSLKILSGCVLPKDRKKMEEIFDVVFGIESLEELPSLIALSSVIPADSTLRLTARRVETGIQSSNGKRLDPRCGEDDKKNYFNYLSIQPKHGNTFQALVPISNGCNNFCSYCAVPYTRGREVSRSFDEIVNEVKDLVKNGYKEITLLGQNVNSYGNDIKGGKSFLDLLEELDKIPGKFWIRFISNHPKDFPNELIENLPKLEKVTPYIHLPLQSGSTKILKGMNRKYTRKDYLTLVEKIRKNIPDVAIGTDTIVGFPGETEKDFEKSIEVFEKSKFDMAYIAQYSPRQGTVSARMKDDISKEIKKQRDKKLNEVLKKTALENNKKYVGKEVEVLVEKEYKGFLWGRTGTYKLVKIDKGPSFVKKSGEIIGRFIKIKIKSATPWTLSGSLLTANSK